MICKVKLTVSCPDSTSIFWELFESGFQNYSVVDAVRRFVSMLFDSFPEVVSQIHYRRMGNPS
jgi:hypothetical protein